MQYIYSDNNNNFIKREKKSFRQIFAANFTY